MPRSPQDHHHRAQMRQIFPKEPEMGSLVSSGVVVGNTEMPESSEKPGFSKGIISVTCLGGESTRNGRLPS